MQSKDAVALKAGGDDPDYKISLFVRNAKLNPAVQMSHTKALVQHCAVYLLHLCQGVPMKTFVKIFGNNLVVND